MHLDFYYLKRTEESEAYSISGLITVLNDKLKSIKLLRFDSAEALIEKNQQLQEAAKQNDKNNFILLLHNVQSLSDDYKDLELNVNNSIFEDLKKVQTRYPSVKKYLDLWLTERDNIILFFKNLLEAVAQNNLDNLSKAVVSVLNHLDNYIVDAARKLINKVTDEEIRKMLDKMSNINTMNELIESIIKDIMNSKYLEYYIVEYIENYRATREDEKVWKECIEYQIMLLNPLIKYSLAIILSNMVLVEYDKDNTAQGINKEEFYNKLKAAIKNSYDKTVKSDDMKELDYLSMIVRYIFFDMNRSVNSPNNNKITLSAHLIASTKQHLRSVSEATEHGSTTGYDLVRPFFTHYDKEAKGIEKQDNNKTIKKREVFTQYVYEEDNGNPILYCDIHHMPIRGIQEIDGTVIEIPSKITIYSSDAFKPDQHGYTYTQLTFIRNMVIPRYKFAESALVNLLLIAGIQEIQRYLSSRRRTVSGLINARFAPFAITNLYHYYYKDSKYDEIDHSNKSAYELITKVTKNDDSISERKHLHPLLASILLSFDRDNKDVKNILQNDYGLQNPATYSRRDEFINALRLRFYSSEGIGNIQSIEYDMYSIYEPGVSIK
jgi:regulator of sigma D